MSLNVNMSLEDIISSNKSSFSYSGGKNKNVRSRGTKRGGNPGVSRDRRTQGPTQTQTRTQQDYSRGDINDKWSHDLYAEESSKLASQRKTHQPLQGRSQQASQGRSQYASRLSSRLEVSNLHFEVSDSDIQELFAPFGTVVKCGVHYDSSGRSKGTGFVKFSNTLDAKKAQKEYHNIQLDGQAMQIQFGEETSAQPSAPERLLKRLQRDIAPKSDFASNRQSKDRSGGSRDVGERRKNNFPDRRRGGARGGRGNRSGSQKTIPTSEDLDAELDAYITQAPK